MKRLSPLALCILLPACFAPEPFAGAETDGAETTEPAEESSEGDQGEETTEPAGTSTGEGAVDTTGAAGIETGGEADDESTTGDLGNDGEQTDGEQTDGGQTDGEQTVGEDTGYDTGEPVEPQRVFVTGSTYAADEVALADQHCQSAANDAELGGNWVAWVSGALGDAVDRLPDDGGPYVLTDAAQTLVANDVDDLTDGSIEAAINVDEDGNGVGAPFAVWTGTGVTGTKDVDNCLDWSVSTSAQDGRQGNHGQTNGSWTRALSPYCSTNARLYCFEI